MHRFLLKLTKTHAAQTTRSSSYQETMGIDAITSVCDATSAYYLPR